MAIPVSSFIIKADVVAVVVIKTNLKFLLENDKSKLSKRKQL